MKVTEAEIFIQKVRFEVSSVFSDKECQTWLEEGVGHVEQGKRKR